MRRVNAGKRDIPIWGTEGTFRFVLAGEAGRADNPVRPRTARAAVGGSCYHVLNPGTGRAAVFHDDADYAAIAGLLRAPCACWPTACCPTTSTSSPSRGRRRPRRLGALALDYARRPL